MLNSYIADIPSGGELPVDSDVYSAKLLRNVYIHEAIHYLGITDNGLFDNFVEAVTGTSGFSLPYFHRAFEIIAKNPAHYRRLITHRFDLAGAEEAFRILAAGEALKVLIRP